MLKRIHVNQHTIRANHRNGGNTAPITVKTYKANLRAYGVAVAGPSRLVYSPEDPLACGARLWIETSAPVTTYDSAGRAMVELR